MVDFDSEDPELINLVADLIRRYKGKDLSAGVFAELILSSIQLQLTLNKIRENDIRIEEINKEIIRLRAVPTEKSNVNA